MIKNSGKRINKVFVDTSAFVSIWDDNDPNHNKAISLFKKLVEYKAKIVTSSDIIGESLTVISRKLSKVHAGQFLKESQKQGIKEIFIDEYIHKETRGFFFKVKSKNISFVDCSSVIAMRKNKLDTIFSFDEDFRRLGIKLLEDVV